MKQLWDLFYLFAKIGGFTFGGGYAMLPILQREIVENRHWITDEELADYYAIGQCTPGIIAVNTATLVGERVKGTLGGIIATLGVVTPSVIILSIIAAFISNFTQLVWVGQAFAGIRVCVSVLILNAIVKLWKKSVVDRFTLFLFLCVFVGATFTNISPAYFVFLAAGAGIFFQRAKLRHSDPTQKGGESQ